jgi:hypothetical protein
MQRSMSGAWGMHWDSEMLPFTRARSSQRLMPTTRVIAVTIAALMGGCGPEVPDDEEPVGELVYEHPASAFYKLDRRVEVVALSSTLSRDGCGYLTDRAYDDLEQTIAALDPSADYDEGVGCFEQADPKGLVYLDGFEHSPFRCDWDCCHPELGRVSLVYSMVENNLAGLEPVVDGSPYVAIEPDRPCE